jgi:transposase
MTLTIVETRAITGGVDTHADTHVAAALDRVGGLLGVREFPATAAGYARLVEWLGGFGTVGLVGIEGTGSYGAGLARYVAAAGVRVVEVDRSDRQDRRRAGKSDPLDAVSAARAAQSGRASGAPRGRDGQVEAIRALMVAKRTARAQRTQTINQARALIVTGPDDIRARFTRRSPAELVAGLAALRPRPGSMARYHTLLSLRELGRRAQYLDAQLARLDELITPLVTARAPGLLGLYGAGPDTAAMLLIAAGDHPGRLRSEAARAHLCGTAPIPASSGKVTRHRPQPRRGPPGQPRPVADRHHPDGLAPADPRLRRPADQGGPVQEGDHPLPQAVRRPRGLPAPAPAIRLTPKLRGRPGPLSGCRAPAGLRTIRRPPPALTVTLPGVTS